MNSMTMNAKHKSPAGKSRSVTVCNLDDLIENVGQCALVAGCQVALFRLSDNERIYGISNYDPFSNANVLSRGVVGDLRGRLVVASPIYKQHFDLETGECLEDARVKLAVFPVRVEDGRVVVDVPAESC